MSIDRLLISTLVNARFWEKGRVARDSYVAGSIALAYMVLFFCIGYYGDYHGLQDIVSTHQYLQIQKDVSSFNPIAISTYQTHDQADTLTYIYTSFFSLFPSLANAFPSNFLNQTSSEASTRSLNILSNVWKSNTIIYDSSLFASYYLLLSLTILCHIMIAIAFSATIYYAALITIRTRSLTRLLSYSSASPKHLQKRIVDIEVIVTHFSTQASPHIMGICLVFCVRSFGLLLFALTTDTNSRYILEGITYNTFFIFTLAIHPLILICSVFMHIGSISGEVEFVKRLLWRASLVFSISKKQKMDEIIVTRSEEAKRTLHPDTSKRASVSETEQDNTTGAQLHQREQQSSPLQNVQQIEADLSTLLEYMDAADLYPRMLGTKITPMLFVEIAVGSLLAYTTLLKYKYRQFI